MLLCLHKHWPYFDHKLAEWDIYMGDKGWGCTWLAIGMAAPQDPQSHMFHGFEGMNHQGKSLQSCSHLPVRHDFSAIAFEPDMKKEFKRVGEYQLHRVRKHINQSS